MTENEIDNGNGKSKKIEMRNAQTQILIDEETKKALMAGNSTEEVNEPTKYILFNDAFVQSVFDDRIKHFTKYLDRDEVLQVNDIETHARLIPVVFKSRNPEVNKRILKVKELFEKHCHDHMDNMTSLDNKGGNMAKLLVLAMKNDSNPLPTDKEMKRMFGGK